MRFDQTVGDGPELQERDPRAQWQGLQPWRSISSWASKPGLSPLIAQRQLTAALHVSDASRDALNQYDSDNWRNRAFKPAAARLGAGQRPYDLRHALRIAADHLGQRREDRCADGHDAVLTLRTYAHPV